MEKGKARFEPTLIIFDNEEKTQTPQIAVLRDAQSGHFVQYKLVEMNGDDIKESYNSVGAAPQKVPE